MSQAKQHSRTIIHVDIDCFYAQVEMNRDPSLKNQPLGVKQKTYVVTCNYIARSLGVQKLMLIKDALVKCPQLVLVSGEDLTNYRKVSQDVTSLITETFTPYVERLGFDENYIDVTDLVKKYAAKEKEMLRFEGHIFDNENPFEECEQQCTCGCIKNLAYGSIIASKIRSAILTKLHLTTSAGISHNKILSKLVGATHKHDQQTTLLPQSTLSLLNTLNTVKKIPGIGHAMAKKLSEKGITTVSDLQNCSIETITHLLGKETAQRIKMLSFGIDKDSVVISGKPKSHGLEDSFQVGCTLNECETKISHMTEKLLHRVLEDGRLPQTVRLIIRKKNYMYKRESRQMGIPSEIFKSFCFQNIGYAHSKLKKILLEMLQATLAPSEINNLTLLGVTFTKFEDDTITKNTNSIKSYFEKRPGTAKRPIGNASTNTEMLKRRKIYSPVNMLTNFCRIPPDIDKDIFKELPPDLKKELIQTWYNQRNAK